MSNPWDILSPLFKTDKDESKISTHVADHILIACPVVLDFIKQNTANVDKLNLLDYGCGNGLFAYNLSKFGFKVTGIDSSKEMIINAKASYGENVKFLIGDSSIISNLSPFSIITSVMTFQFIENIKKTLTEITKALIPGGIFIFAVHNPAQIKAFIPLGILFEDFDSNENPKKGILNVDSTKIPIFIRTAQEYNEILEPMGYELLLEKYPPFTKKFIEEYPSFEYTNVPEFLILGYKKLK